MKVLITGATGFIGSHVAEVFENKGFDIVCTVRKTSNLRWLKDKPYNLLYASLSDKSSLVEAVSDVDYIVHVAGLTAARNYEEFLRGNRDGTINLAEAVIESGTTLKRFVHISSQTVSGPSTSLELPVTEDTPCIPITSYGKSKFEAEKAILSYREHFPVTIIRPPAVFGPRDTAIFDVFKTIKTGLAPLIGFTPKYVSLIHINDLARGILDAAIAENTANETYFISSEEFYTWEQVNKLIANAFGKKPILIKLPHLLVLSLAWLSELIGRFSKHPPVFNYEKGIDFIQSYWTCSTEKAKRDFGYRQQVSIEEAVAITVEWYKSQKWL